MKIGFNYKAIKNFVMNNIIHMGILFNNALNSIQSDINNLDTRITTVEENLGSEWIEITSSNGQEAEITQEFSEIRLMAKCSHNSYTFTSNYDSTIFHNTAGNADTYLICGNPIENNYGCKFKYTKLSGKQYVCVDSCYNGGSQDAYAFRAWIKPVPNNSLQ